MGFGAVIVPRCLPSALKIQMPPGADRYRLPQHVDLDAVERFLSRDLLREIDERLGASEGAVPLHGKTRHGLRGRIPVADVEELLVGRERDAVRSFEVVGSAADACRSSRGTRR